MTNKAAVAGSNPAESRVRRIIRLEA